MAEEVAKKDDSVLNLVEYSNDPRHHDVIESLEKALEIAKEKPEDPEEAIDAVLILLKQGTQKGVAGAPFIAVLGNAGSETAVCLANRYVLTTNG